MSTQRDQWPDIIGWKLINVNEQRKTFQQNRDTKLGAENTL